MGRPQGSKTSPTRPPLRFYQSEIDRAIRSVQARGLCIGRIEVDPVTGKIAIVTEKSRASAASNPWDTVLPNGTD